MASDFTWRLGRLRHVLNGAWRHLRREGPWRTAATAVARAGGMPRGDARALVAPAGDDAARRRRVLVIDALMPDPARDSGSVRLCHMLQILRGMGWSVDFMPDNLRATAAERTTLEALGVRVLCRPDVSSLLAWLRREGAGLQAVVLCRHYVAAEHVDLVRRYAPSARLCFDTIDLHHLREARAAARGRASRRQLRRIARVRHEELALAARCDVTFVVSPVEQALLEREVPGAHVRLLSNIHRPQPDVPGYDARRDLVFVGGWGHPPNRDAIAWLVHDIMPLLRTRLPDIELHLAGELPAGVRARMVAPGVRIHGRVPDLAPMMRRCRVALAPLRYGAGIKGKINTAMSYGMPVVATTVAIEGMNLAEGRDVLVADTPEAFAAQVARLYSDAALWQALSAAGVANVREHFSFERARACLEAVLGPGTAG